MIDNHDESGNSARFDATLRPGLRTNNAESGASYVEPDQAVTPAEGLPAITPVPDAPDAATVADESVPPR